MKSYMMIIRITDGEFEYNDQTIFGWGGDPQDEEGILKDWTGDDDLEKCSWSDRYKSQDYRLYEVYWIKEIQEDHLPILKQYGF